MNRVDGERRGDPRGSSVPLLSSGSPSCRGLKNGFSASVTSCHSVAVGDRRTRSLDPKINSTVSLFLSDIFCPQLSYCCAPWTKTGGIHVIARPRIPAEFLLKKVTMKKIRLTLRLSTL